VTPVSDNDIATARMKVRIAAADLRAAELTRAHGEDRAERVRSATVVLDDAVVACARLLGGAS
jgi:hypothetical protein